ncbi:hypothetical protein, partial [Aeromonas sp. JL9]|uniref:hypothetical protein n=1 Tax=Aeromonas sp. JL9 TaxID=2950549 RepID=UPI00210D8599
DDVSALRIRVFTLAGMAVQLRRNTHDPQKMVTTSFLFLTCSSKRALAALSKTALSTDFSHSSNGGAKRGSQANTPKTRRKLITLLFNDDFYFSVVKILQGYMGFFASGLMLPSI